MEDKMRFERQKVSPILEFSFQPSVDYIACACAYNHEPWKAETVESSHHNLIMKEENSEAVSILFQADEGFVNRILSRNSSVGRNSCGYYYGILGQVPFEWEEEPGKPKDATREEVVPLDCRLLPVVVPNQSFLQLERSKLKAMFKPRVWFWKKFKKNQKHKKV